MFVVLQVLENVVGRNMNLPPGERGRVHPNDPYCQIHNKGQWPVQDTSSKMFLLGCVKTHLSLRTTMLLNQFATFDFKALTVNRPVGRQTRHSKPSKSLKITRSVFEALLIR